MEDRLYDLAAVAEVFAVGAADGFLYFCEVCVVAAAPVLAQGLVGGVGLAAGGVVADVGLGVGRLFAAHAVHYIGAGGYGLGLERLRLEGGGHLPGHDPGQPVGHGDGQHLAAREHGEAQLGVAAAQRRGGGGCLRRPAVLTGGGV